MGEGGGWVLLCDRAVESNWFDAIAFNFRSRKALNMMTDGAAPRRQQCRQIASLSAQKLWAATRSPWRPVQLIHKRELRPTGRMQTFFEGKKKNSISDKVNWFLAWIYLVRWGQQAGPELMGTASLSALRWPTGETMGPLCGSHLIYRACWQSDSVYLHSRGQVQHKAPCVLGCTEEWQADRWP